MRHHTNNITKAVDSIGENWTDKEGQEFVAVWHEVLDGSRTVDSNGHEGHTESLDELFKRIDAVALFMNYAYKAYMERKEANAQSVNVA